MPDMLSFVKLLYAAVSMLYKLKIKVFLGLSNLTMTISLLPSCPF